MYEVKIEKISDTDQFRPAIKKFLKDGYYCAAPTGTTQYRNYWDEETRRCIYGYTSPKGNFISGYNYFYLNYSIIVIVSKDPYTGRESRVEGFPDFYDYDKAYFDAVEEAERVGKHLAVIKKRGAGYSFKGASMLARNFCLIPTSKSYAIAAEREFLTKDGLLSKAYDILSHIDKHTAWGKKKNPDQLMIKTARYKTKDEHGVEIEGGFNSSIIGVSLKNDYQKARGKRGKLILWEEGGKFPNLKAAWQIAQPSVETNDGKAFGLMIAFGTGGTEGADFEGLRDIFYEPQVYNALPIKNIWDEGATKPCGFFVPQYYNMGKDFMDKDGNSLVIESLQAELEKRKIIIENSSDKRSVDRYIAERPFSPQEATLQLSGNIFPKEEMIRQLAFIRNNKKVRDQKQVGDLITDENGLITWEPAKKPKDITKYRLDRDEDRTGQIVIWEHPPEDPPYGLYIAGIDPYDHDKSGTDSLGSTFIYKRFQNFEEYHDVIVAEYTGRPETAEQYYDNVYKLLKYFNALALYENEKKGLFQHLSKMSCEYLLADQPDIISDIVNDSKVQRKKGIHMSTSIKDWGENRIRDWLKEPIGEGKMMLHNILSEPLLEELIAYNDTGNFDRVMALMMVMIYREELHKVHVKEKKTESKQQYLFPDGICLNHNMMNLKTGTNDSRGLFNF